MKQQDISSELSIGPGSGQLRRAAIAADACFAEIYLHGAHVTRFQPKNSAPVIWMSGFSLFQAGKPIRGGVPICFPWFGPKAGDAKAPAHGFARTMEWNLDSTERMNDGAICVAMSLRSNDQTKALWPADFVARQVVTFGSTLAMEFSVRNTGSSPAKFEAALHSYFAVGDIRQVSVLGLENATYLDRLKPGERFTQDSNPIRFTAETDRTYVNTTATVTIVDPSMNRKIVIEKRGSNSTVVWNPWIAKAKAMADFGDDEWTGMLCIETADAGENAITLPPAGEHTMRAKISVA